MDALKKLLLAAVLCLGVASAQAQTISNLPSASTPLGGSETLPCVQGGVTKKCSVTAVVGAVTLPTIVGNSLIGNSFSTSTTAFSVPLPNCGGSLNALAYTNGSGFSCNNFSGQFMTTGLNTGQIWIGNGSNIATARTMSNDCTLSITGAITCTSTNGVAFAASATTNALNASNISSGVLSSNYGGAGNITGILQANGAGVVSSAGSSPTITVAGAACTLGSSCWTASGAGSKLATSTGTLTNGDCVSIDGTGNLIDAGGPCTTGGGGGTVASSTANYFTYYTGTGTVVGGTANLQYNANGVTFTKGIVNTVRTVTAAGAVTVTAADYFLCINKTVGAATTVNLPATPATGLTFIVKDCKGDAQTNNITITPNSGTIDGAATYVIRANRDSVDILFNGVEWSVF